MSRAHVQVGPMLEALGIQAKYRHGYWEARCPFHDDHNPDWRIVDDPADEKHALHHCKSCLAGGTPASLVMHVRGYASWASAFEWLKQFESAEPLPARVRVESQGWQPFRVPVEVIWDPMTRWVSGAIRYGMSRGLTPEQVDRWGVGYAVDGRLAGRIVFPLKDGFDLHRSYQARIFAGEGPRYLTPKEEDFPDKAAVFGERHWPDPRVRKGARLVVWEGAIKAMAFERACPGEPFAVLGGVHVDPLHVAKLATFGEVVIATDKNRAGDKAAAELEGALSRHVRLSRAILPKDPDEMPPREVAEYFR
jgi:DNA primase